MSQETLKQLLAAIERLDLNGELPSEIHGELIDGLRAVCAPVQPPAEGLPEGCPKVLYWGSVGYTNGKPSQPALHADPCHDGCSFISVEVHPRGTKRRLSALTVGKGAASDYDKAVEALAPYLGDGWYTVDDRGMFERHEIGEKPPFVSANPLGRNPEVWINPSGSSWFESSMRLPKTEDWRSSLRRIEGGKVVAKEGGEP